ncbi:MAG: DciA family protein [Rickettsiales bacterium]
MKKSKNNIFTKIASDLFRKSNSDKSFLSIVNNWEFIAGKEFAKVSAPVRIKNSRLEVSICSNSHAIEFDYEKNKFLKKIQSLISPELINGTKISVDYNRFQHYRESVKNKRRLSNREENVKKLLKNLSENIKKT